MKIKALRVDLNYSTDSLVIVLPKGQHREALRLVDSVAIDDAAEYAISIKKKDKNRSLNANAYMWVLVGKLAYKENMLTSDVYREYVKELGTYYETLVRADAVEDFQKAWKANGLGWFAVDMGEQFDREGFHVIHAYYGSSQYTREQMAHLIELIVQDCKERDIETLPPAELRRMTEAWCNG